CRRGRPRREPDCRCQVNNTPRNRTFELHGRPAAGDQAVTDPALLPLTEAAAAIRDKRLSSLELTKSLLARIELWQPALKAFVRLEREAALNAAQEADAALARGELRGPLHGVPLAHKDMYYRAGKPAECGSKIRAGWIAPGTATALQRLANAGALY